MAKSLVNPSTTWFGKAGDKVYTKLFGYQIERQYAKPSNPRTEKQQLTRARFNLLVQLATIFSTAANIGLKRVAYNGKMFPANKFVSLNYPNVTGTTPDNVSIDPTKIVTADGNLTGVVFSSTIGTSTPGTITMTVTDVNAGIGNASDEDNIYCFAYCPDAGNGVLSAPARRTDGATLSVRYPTSWSGLEVHVYGFVVNSENRASRSEYVGHAELG